MTLRTWAGVRVATAESGSAEQQGVSQSAAELSYPNPVAYLFFTHLSACLKLSIRLQSPDTVDFAVFVSLIVALAEAWNFGISYHFLMMSAPPSPMPGFDIRIILAL